MAFRKFKINWVLKAAAFSMLDKLPAREKAYYLLQRYVTKTIPRPLTPTSETAEVQIAHAHEFLLHGVDLTKARLMEFGAGWDLYSNIIMYCFGVERQSVFDINRWAKAEAINAVVRHLQSDPADGAIRVPEKFVHDERLESELEEFYGISYHAPADARHLAVEDNTFDLITTTSTLEHIPKDLLPDIIKECYRVLRPGGLMRHVIDYSDHYAHADPNINEFNYLRFDDKQWAKFNPGIHFQNRLRTRFYRELFQAAGFEIIDLKTRRGSHETLASVPVSAVFEGMSYDEMLDLGGNFLMAKPAIATRPSALATATG